MALSLHRGEYWPLNRRQRYRAELLLRADSGETDAENFEWLGVSPGTVANVHRRFDAALFAKSRPGASPLRDGKAEAIVIATACSPVPKGRATRIARMLGNCLVELRVVKSVSENTILRVLKGATSSRGRRTRGAAPRA